MNRIHLPLLLAAGLALPHAAMAQEHRPHHQPRILVAGEGEASVAPDMALISLSVMREAETARAALDENNAAMASVIAAMREAGIESRDLQTAGLNISPRYVYPQGDGEQQPRIVAYQVSNTLSVRVRDLARAGEILDSAVTLGVNQGGNITFTNDDPGAAITQARIRAVEDAMARARTLAEAAGVELGGIVELTEQTFTQQPVPQDGRAMRMEAPASAAVPVEAGENTYRVQVNVTFELKQ